MVLGRCTHRGRYHRCFIPFGTESEGGPLCLAVKSGGNPLQRRWITSRSFQDRYLASHQPGAEAILTMYEIAATRKTQSLWTELRAYSSYRIYSGGASNRQHASSHGAWIEISFPVYSTTLSGWDTAAPEPCPADTHVILNCTLAGISG